MLLIRVIRWSIGFGKVVSEEKIQTSKCGLARILYFLLYFPHAEKLDSKCKV